MGSQMAAKLSTLSASRPLLPGILMVLILLNDEPTGRPKARFKRLIQLKKSLTSSEIKPATFHIAA
jgi:outer membrane usher protein FimD/PapC